MTRLPGLPLAGWVRKAEEEHIRRQKRYEQHVLLKYVLNQAAPTKTKRDWREDAMACFQADHLDLPWFRLAFPNFPLQLRALKIPYAHKLIQRPFHNGRHSTPVRALFDFADELHAEESTNLAIVFPVIRHGDLVIHNCGSHLNFSMKSDARTKPDFCLILNAYNPQMCVEPFDRLIRRLGNHWYRQPTRRE